MHRQNQLFNQTNSCCDSCNTNGVIEDLLGTKIGSSSGELLTVGVSVQPQSILLLGLAVLGAGLIIKNTKF